jgi:hypothetical protein
MEMTPWMRAGSMPDSAALFSTPPVEPPMALNKLWRPPCCLPVNEPMRKKEIFTKALGRA